MNSQSLASIVLPVYNGSKYLVESIDSCINQTYKNWELIIVNDCSKDNSLEIAKEYAAKDARIKVIDNEQNKKLPASLNVGFANAKGKYYTWTSHDNRFHPAFLEKYVDYLESHPEIGFLTGTYQMMDAAGKMLDLVALQDPQIYMPYINPIAYAFMYRADIAKLAGEYNVNLFLVEDYEYWVRLWLHTKVARIEVCLYYARVHKDTLTFQRKAEIAQKLVEMRMMYFEKFDAALVLYPDLKYKFYISIVENLNGVLALKWLAKLTAKYPYSFGFKYFFVFKPLKFMKKSDFYWKMKKSILKKEING